MGCDGGTIPKRHELIKKKEKKETKDKQADTAAKWQYCSSSSNKLVQPIVACELGRLYNKDSVLEYLLNKDCANASMMKHIRNLKDVIELKLTKKQSYNNGEASSSSKGSKGGEKSTQDSEFVCPIANIELNGQYKFYTIRTCGCVFSERALKTIKTESCLVCSKPFVQDDLVLLNGSDEEVREMETKMLERRSKAKEAKEAKKNKRKAEAQTAISAPAESEASSSSGNSQEEGVAKRPKTDNENGNSSEAGPKRPKSSAISTSASTVSNTKASAQIVNKNYSVSKDSKASEAYKSLFTTHESAKSKPKAPWVTFNPMYN